MNYTLIRSRRKTLALQLKTDGSLLVRCPLKMSLHEVEGFIQAKQSWILSKQQMLRENTQKREAFRLQAGMGLRYLGKTYPLRISENPQSGFDARGFFLGNKLPEEKMQARVVKIYKQLATVCITAKVEHYSRLYKLQPKAIRIGSAKTRWGSCNSKNQLCFSWRLIMADELCVDYVVLHELAHTLEHNHSKHFWTKLGRMMPDYPQARQQLRLFGRQLQTENW
ncbi:MAG: SprT family zinc-dependent metalloprotease [Bacteroidales bacterium]|nr:SprT family zinc-dependent metalloprotease [Bacteroidales bacterium]